ncbi:MAG TPA: SAM-dependent methyltransferase [Streptosporangiales bacterium]
MPDPPVPAGHPPVDTKTPSVARMYDYLLGGKDNFAADRAVCDQLIAVEPDMPAMVRENRAWQGRVLRWLVQDAGIDQFLDVGSGLPTAENTHEVVLRLAPDARVVYADNDPAVLAFGRALMDDDDHAHFVAADLTRPDEVITHPTVTGSLDLNRPVALLQGLTLHHLPDTEQVRSVMRTYIDALAPGSYVAVTHARLLPEDDSPAGRAYHEMLTRFHRVFPNLAPRTADEILSLLPGLEPVPPGLVPLDQWWPNGPRIEPAPPITEAIVGVVARKP